MINKALLKQIILDNDVSLTSRRVIIKAFVATGN